MILRHVLRPALISIITVAGLAFAGLLSGTVLVENIFAWPGLGQYAYHSAINLDLPAIMGVSLFIALVYIVINLVVDLLYGVIDPRIRLVMNRRPSADRRRRRPGLADDAAGPTPQAAARLAVRVAAAAGR